MKSVVLSTNEAEYMALSEVVKELKFTVQLLHTINIEVELPIIVYVDNTGAIWLSNNRTTSDRTKHIGIRTSFVKISRRWKNHHQICEVSRKRSRHFYKEHYKCDFSQSPKEVSVGQDKCGK